MCEHGLQVQQQCSSLRNVHSITSMLQNEVYVSSGKGSWVPVG